MKSISVLALAAGLLPILTAGLAAAEREPFEKVKNWEIERTVADTSANPCIMSYSYKDKADENAENAIVFALDGSNAILVLGYEHWEWDKDEKVKGAFIVGKKIVDAKSKWVGDGTLLRAKFPDTVVPDLLSAKTIELRFKDGEAEFEIPGFAQAYESLRRCDIGGARARVAAAPVAAPAPAAPAGPSETRIKAYALGLIVQQVIKECDVATTTKQRGAAEAKIAAMQPEMAALDANLREQVNNRAAPHCPPAGDEPKFMTTLQDFIDKTPEQFLAAVDKRAAEAGSAGAKGTPEAGASAKP